MFSIQGRENIFYSKEGRQVEEFEKAWNRVQATEYQCDFIRRWTPFSGAQRVTLCTLKRYHFMEIHNRD